MTWLRIDDSFAQHPKIVRLAKPDRWTWLEVLLYCARFRTAGVVPEAIGEVVKRATPPFLQRCFELNLLETGDNGEYVVHNWARYNPKDPTGAERQERFRHSHASRNGQASDATVTPPLPHARGARARSRPVPVSQNPSEPGMNYDPAIGEAEANYADSGGREAKPERGGDFERIDPAAELRRTLEANRA